MVFCKAILCAGENGEGGLYDERVDFCCYYIVCSRMVCSLIVCSYIYRSR